jgi:hypothetical protein
MGLLLSHYQMLNVDAGDFSVQLERALERIL